MARYRIKVEALDPAEELRAEYRMGFECDGFCFITDTGVAIQELSDMKIALSIARDSDLLTAAIIGKAIAESRKYTARAKALELISAMEKMGDDQE